MRWDRLMPNKIMYLTLLALCCFGSISAQSQQPPDKSKLDSDRTNGSLKSDPIAEAEKLALALGDVDLKKRRDAAYQLATMGKAATPAIDALIGQLDDRDEQVWMQSVMAIGKIGPEAERAIEPLCKTFAD